MFPLFYSWRSLFSENDDQQGTEMSSIVIPNVNPLRRQARSPAEISNLKPIKEVPETPPENESTLTSFEINPPPKRGKYDK